MCGCVGVGGDEWSSVVLEHLPSPDVSRGVVREYVDCSKIWQTNLVQNSPPEVKMPRPIIIVEKNTFFFVQKSRTPPIEKKITYTVYYKYQQAA